MNQLPYISFVIPYYNSTRSVIEIYNELSFSINSISLKYEIIIIDDCSKNTNDTNENYNKENLYCERLPYNRGQDYTTSYGITKTNGDVIITFDDDLFYTNELVSKILSEYINRRVDVLYCIRDYNEQHSPIRKFLQFFIKKTFYLLFRIRTSSIRVLNPTIKFQVLSNLEEEGLSLDKLIYTNNNKIEHLFIDIRSAGKSRYNIKRLATVFFNFLFYKKNNLYV